MGHTIRELSDAVATLASKDFPDLGFLDPGGVLDIDARVGDAVCVRLELPRTEFFALNSVLLDIDGDQQTVAGAEVVASSTLRGYGQHLAKRLLFNPDFRGTAFHTRKGHRQWLEIRLREPVDLHRIRLRNVPTGTAARARGIRVLVRSSAGGWHTAYDATQRALHFAQATESLQGVVDDAPIEELEGPYRSSYVGADLARIITRLHSREYDDSLVRELGRVPLLPAAKHRFKEVVNADLLSDRKLEWTSHGIRRSFRFWTQEEKERYVAFAMSVVDDLGELSGNVCLGFGSVLSVVRDRDLMPHDDDLDIIVGFESSQASTIADGLQLIETTLGEMGYLVRGANGGHRLVSRPGHKKVDVFVGVFEGDRIDWYPGNRGTLRRGTVFPPRRIDFLGSTCAIPARPKKYLKQIYGPTWTVPDPHFKHTGTRSDYADIIG